MSRAHTAADCAEQAGSAIATNCLNAILNAPSQAESVSMHARALLLEVARQFHRDDNGRMLLSRAFRHGLGIFIRSLVGLDRETAAQAFSEFVVGTTATADQIEFIDLIIEELTANGVVERERLYEPPFTDINAQGPTAIFPVAKLDQLESILIEIRKRAAA